MSVHLNLNGKKKNANMGEKYKQTVNCVQGVSNVPHPNPNFRVFYLEYLEMLRVRYNNYLGRGNSSNMVPSDK